MKKSKAVMNAEGAYEAAKRDLEAAKKRAQELVETVAAALAAIRSAQERDDAPLPQCRVVSVYRGKESGDGRQVILRKTPAGRLVTRTFGDTSGLTSKWRWQMGRYVSDKKQRFYVGSSLELRDVPAQFLPTRSEQDQ